MVLIAVLAALFVLLPLLDRSGHSSIKRRTLVAVPFLLWMLFLALSLMISTGIPG
jgi:quinol-cytochrome oxidoreductase complex cytochrome b subunit